MSAVATVTCRPMNNAFNSAGSIDGLTAPSRNEPRISVPPAWAPFSTTSSTGSSASAGNKASIGAVGLI